MATFRTQFEKHEHSHAPAGTKIEIRHNPVMLKDGRRKLEKTRQVAVYDLIQANREQCEIENIIRRAIEGDYNALHAVNGVYSDITNCPSSIAEAQQFIINAKNEFENLPKEIKSKFEFNPEIYVAEMSNDTNTWLDKMGYNEAIKLQKQQEEEYKKTSEYFAKAMETIASGNSITNAGGENNE